MNQERSLKFLKIPYPFQHLAIHQGHSKILLLKKEQLIGQSYSKQSEKFSNQKRTSIFSTRFYTSLRKITQYPYQDNINERNEIYDHRVDYLPKKSLSHVIGKLITQCHFDPMQSLLGFIITQKGSLAVSDHQKLKFFVANFCVFQEFRFNNIQLTYFKLIYQMITQDENLISSMAFSTPKKSQQDLIFAFKTSQRKQSISESRQKIMNSVQIQNAKIDQFMSFIFKLREDPSDLIYNQMVEFFDNEKEDLNIFAQQITRRILIDEIYDDSQAEVINKILLFMIKLEVFEDELDLIQALFNIFYNFKDQESHINCLRLLKGIFKRNTTLAKKMEEYLTKGFFINILLLNENSPKILKLVSQVCLVLMREHVSYDLQAFKSKIVKTFIKAVQTKDLKVIHGILFLLSGEHCEDNAEAICRLTYLLKQVPQLNRTQLLKDLDDLIPEQLNIMTFNNNYFPLIAQRAVIYCVINSGFQEQQLYLQYFYRILDKLPTLQQVFDFFEIFWLSISNKEPQIKQSTRRIFSQNGFWYLIKQVFSKIIQNCPDPSDVNYQIMVEFYYYSKGDLIEFTKQFIREMVVRQNIIYKEGPIFINKLILFMISIDLFNHKLDFVQELFVIFERIKNQECHCNCLKLLNNILRRNSRLIGEMQYQEKIIETIFRINIKDSPETLRLLSSEDIQLRFPVFYTKISKIFKKALELGDPKIILTFKFLLDTLEQEDRELIINEQSRQINQVCQEKFYPNDYVQCSQIFKIILYCSRNSYVLQYVFLDKYIDRLSQLNDIDHGRYGARLLYEELDYIQQDELSQNKALEYLQFLNYALQLDDTIKMRFFYLIHMITVRTEDGELYLVADQDKKIGEELIDLVGDVFCIL